MRSAIGPLWKSTAFIVVTVLATAMLAMTIRNGGTPGGSEFHAVFSDAPSVNKGDDVRIHGVRVGQVTGVAVTERRFAKVSFLLDPEIELSSDARAAIRFRNLIGQRYVSLEAGTAGKRLARGATIPIERTEPALDLTALFNGFQPLFRMLAPEDVNELSHQIISVFQGEGSTVEGLVEHTAGLAGSLAERDQVIGRVITNLSVVLDDIGGRSDEMTALVVNLQQLVSGLAEDRAVIGGAVSSMADLTTSVAELVEKGRPPLKRSIINLDRLASNLVGAEQLLVKFLAGLPLKLERLGRTTSYGGWMNMYLCAVEGAIPDVEGYAGDRGVANPAGRCSR